MDGRRALARFRSLKLSFFVVSSLLRVTLGEANGPQTRGEVEKLIRESLPVGSDRIRVIQVLSDRGIETSGLQSRSGTVYAIIRSPAGTSSIRSAIAMEFFFDEGGRLLRRGRLLRHEVRELPTRPIAGARYPACFVWVPASRNSQAPASDFLTTKL
jgi:hypothetical protein